MKQQRRWWYFPESAALQQAVSERIVQIANSSIEARGAFHLVLAGGRTPAGVYEKLIYAATDWNAWFIYFGDERCLDPDAADRNDTMARKRWLEQVPVPANHIYSIPAELGPDAGAAFYCGLLAPVGTFDLVLLGLGEDGHTASLFPGQPLDGPNNEPALPVFNAPKPPPERVSLSAARLSDARAVWFLVTGPDKREPLLRWERGEEIPAAAICPPEGVDIYTDVDIAAATK